MKTVNISFDDSEVKLSIPFETIDINCKSKEEIMKKITNEFSLLLDNIPQEDIISIGYIPAFINVTFKEMD